MATVDIWVHEHGRSGVCVDTVNGTKKDAKQAAKDAAKVWYPHASTAWNGDTALLVKREDGSVQATIAIEIPEVREVRERKVKA